MGNERKLRMSEPFKTIVEFLYENPDSTLYDIERGTNLPHSTIVECLSRLRKNEFAISETIKNGKRVKRPHTLTSKGEIDLYDDIVSKYHEANGRALRRQIIDEQRNSFLTSYQNAKSGFIIGQRHVNMIFRGRHPKSAGGFAKGLNWDLPFADRVDEKAFGNNVDGRDHDTLRKYVASTGRPGLKASIAPNSARAFKAMKRADFYARGFDQGYSIDIDTSQPSGSLQIEKLAGGTEKVDVIIVGLSAFSFAHYKHYDFVKDYVLALAVSGERQSLLVPRVNKTLEIPLSAILSAKDSATEATHLIGGLYKVQSIIKPSYETILLDAKVFIEGGFSLGKSDAVLVWSPLDMSLVSSKKLVVVPGFEYNHLVGMFISKDMADNPEVGRAICNVFVASLDEVVDNNSNDFTRSSGDMLADYDDFSKDFALSSGNISPLNLRNHNW